MHDVTNDTVFSRVDRKETILFRHIGWWQETQDSDTRSNNGKEQKSKTTQRMTQRTGTRTHCRNCTILRKTETDGESSGHWRPTSTTLMVHDDAWRKCLHAYMYMLMCMCVCVCAHMYLYMHVSMYVCMYVYMHFNFFYCQPNEHVQDSNKQCINIAWHIQLYTKGKPKRDHSPVG